MDTSQQYGWDTMTPIRVTSTEGSAALRIVYEEDGTGSGDYKKSQVFPKGSGKNTGPGLFLSRDILALTGIMNTETGEPRKEARFEIKVLQDGYRCYA